jgi:signal transduction histidine kinase
MLIAGVVVGAATTLFVTLASGVHFAYRRPVLHAGLETAESLVALLVGYLVVGRFRRTRSVSDLVLASALGILAVGNLFGALPALAAEGEPGRITSWAAVAVRLVGSIVFAAAAFAPTRPLARVRAAASVAAAACAAAVALTVAVLVSAQDALPPVVRTDGAASLARPDLVGHPGALTIQLIAMTAYIAAAVGFLRRSERFADDLLRWLALGAVFAAFARLNYFLYPSLYAQWVYTGDVFRFVFYVMLLIGGLREISGYWVRFASLAVLEERRRLARDLHDGLAQELALIQRRARRLGATGQEQLAVEISAAAQRALDESRRAIAALSRPLDETLDAVLAQTLGDAGERLGTDVQLALDTDVRLAPDMRDDLVRIASEAVANAARHGHAGVVHVQLEKGERIRLRVADDGIGFDPDEIARRTDAGGFGLISMRERAHRHGADLNIESAPGKGTEIEVALP